MAQNRENAGGALRKIFRPAFDSFPNRISGTRHIISQMCIMSATVQPPVSRRFSCGNPMTGRGLPGSCPKPQII